MWIPISPSVDIVCEARSRNSWLPGWFSVFVDEVIVILDNIVDDIGHQSLGSFLLLRCFCDQIIKDRIRSHMPSDFIAARVCLWFTMTNTFKGLQYLPLKLRINSTVVPQAATMRFHSN